MKIKILMQKILHRVFYHKNTYVIQFQILNKPNDKILAENHNDISFICEEKIMHKGLKPNGIWGVFGSNKKQTISVPYEKNIVSIEEIQKFLENYGFKVKALANKPMKRIGNFSN